MYVELNGHLVYVHNGGDCEIYPFDPFFQAVAKLAGRFHAVTLQVDASLGWDSFGWQKNFSCRIRSFYINFNILTR